MPRFSWGSGNRDGSFIPVLDYNGTAHYPLVIYTYGRLEIQFQYLREPFDDLGLRAELLQRLNQLPGIAIPEDAIARRPSITLALLADDRSALKGLKATLEWYCTTIRAHVGSSSTSLA